MPVAGTGPIGWSLGMPYRTAMGDTLVLVPYDEGVEALRGVPA